MQLARPIDAGRMVIVALKSHDGTRIYELSAHVMHCNERVLGDEWPSLSAAN